MIKNILIGFLLCMIINPLGAKPLSLQYAKKGIKIAWHTAQVVSASIGMHYVIGNIPNIIESKDVATVGVGIVAIPTVLFNGLAGLMKECNFKKMNNVYITKSHKQG